MKETFLCFVSTPTICSIKDNLISFTMHCMLNITIDFEIFLRTSFHIIALQCTCILEDVSMIKYDPPSCDIANIPNKLAIYSFSIRMRFI